MSNLAPKLKFAETLKELKWNVLNFIVQSFKLFVGTYITYLKGYDAGYDAGFPKNIQNFNKFDFEKYFSGALVYTGGAAGIWAMHFLVPLILMKLLFLDSVSIKFLESDPLSRIRNNF